MGTHQYIMSQGGMPYFQPTPTMYSYEDLQLLQQRIPHMVCTFIILKYQRAYFIVFFKISVDSKWRRTKNSFHLLQATGYYDMAYQAPTSLATGRESLAYTMSDARYTRGDNNASPVPSTLSQQVGVFIFVFSWKAFNFDLSYLFEDKMNSCLQDSS